MMNKEFKTFTFKNKECKNVYCTYLSTGRIQSSESDIMNSLNLNKTKETVNTRKIKYSYKIQGTEISAEKELMILEELGDDLESWIAEFRYSVLVCNWDEMASLCVLRSLLSSDIFEKIKEKKTVDTILDGLLRIKYPREKGLEFIKQTRSIKQKDYRLTKDYAKNLKAEFRKVEIAQSYSKRESEERLEELFWENLCAKTQNECVKNDWKGYKTILENIGRLEEHLLSQTNTTHQKQTEWPKDNNKEYYKTFPEKPRIRTTNAELMKNSKWCTYHKTNTHSNSECFMQKNKSNKNANEKINYVKNGKISMREQPTIPIKIGNKRHDALLDTGSKFNLLSARVYEGMKPKVALSATSKELFTANNGKIGILGEVELSIIVSDSRKVNLNLYVCRELDCDVILGNEFARANGVKIDYEQGVIELKAENKPKPKESVETNEVEEEILNKGVCSYSEFKIDKNLTKIIEKYKKTNPLIGKIKGIKHSIKLKNENVTLAAKPFPVPFKLFKETKEEIKRLEELGIIRKSSSVYASPCFPIPKKNGNIRIVTDYRKLNSNTLKENFPLPEIFNIMHSLAGSKIFSSLDLNQGFFQISLDEESMNKTSFVVPWGQYEYTVMPFGLSNAPRTFQRAMNLVLEDLDYVKVYMDDVLIHSESDEIHLEHVTEVLSRFYKLGISINYEKSKFGLRKIDFLGYKISPEGVTCNTTKILDKLNLDKTKSKKDIMKIIGILNWFRPFIYKLSEKISTLTDKLKKKNNSYYLTSAEKEAIKEIVYFINKQITIAYPDYSKEFTVYADASESGYGSVVVQEDKIIGLHSGKFLDTQRNYTVGEKELLAIIKCLQHFRKILYGTKIVVHTDHSNLLTERDNYSSRVVRWRSILNEFDIEFKHIKGADNTIADVLSRLFEDKMEKNKSISVKSNKDNVNSIPIAKKVEKFDRWLRKIISNYEKETQGKERFTKIKSIVQRVHRKLGHAGIKRIIKIIKSKINFKGLNKLIFEEINNCKKCTKYKPRKHSYFVEFRAHLTASSPFQKISSDILGPLDISKFDHNFERQSIYIVTITDLYSRYTECFPVTRITNNSIKKTFNKWFDKYGTPSKIIMDNGRQYSSKLINKMLRRKGISAYYTPPYSPQSNGISERVNQKILEVIKTYDGKSLKTCFKFIWNNLNLLRNRTVGFSPTEIIEGFYEDNKNLLEKYNKNLERANKEYEITMNKKVGPLIRVKKGDKIFILNKKVNKLDKNLLGPYKVINLNNKRLWYNDSKGVKCIGIRRVVVAKMRGRDNVVNTPEKSKLN